MVTRTKLTTLPNQAFNWLLKAETALHRRLLARVIRGAVGAAYKKFAQKYPQWANSLFDEHFLTHDAAPILARSVQSDDPPTPAELAAAWVEQHAAENKAYTAEVTPVAADFLGYYEAELQTYQLLR